MTTSEHDIGSEFDADTRHRRCGDGEYAVDVSGRWAVGLMPNGGYLLALAARALGAELGRDDPLTLTGHFLSAARPGPATVRVAPVRRGRTLVTGQASIVQPGHERVRLLATFGGSHGAGPGRDGGRPPRWPEPPELPPPEDCVPEVEVPPDREVTPIAQRFETRFHPDVVGWGRGRPGGEARTGGWIRLRDGRPPDQWVLPVVVDALPPTVFELGYRGWVPTIELTVHLRGRPAPGWLRCWIRSRVVADGVVEEDADVWDSTGRLVAMSRQLALLPRSGR